MDANSSESCCGPRLSSWPVRKERQRLAQQRIDERLAAVEIKLDSLIHAINGLKDCMTIMPPGLMVPSPISMASTPLDSLQKQVNRLEALMICQPNNLTPTVDEVLNGMLDQISTTKRLASSQPEAELSPERPVQQSILEEGPRRKLDFESDPFENDPPCLNVGVQTSKPLRHSRGVMTSVASISDAAWCSMVRDQISGVEGWEALDSSSALSVGQVIKCSVAVQPDQEGKPFWVDAGTHGVVAEVDDDGDVKITSLELFEQGLSRSSATFWLMRVKFHKMMLASTSTEPTC
eukprot:TRINITY_DN1908_c0_g4_i1.p1 TRINITY_DN1908_c0_g4~~TRINITY_DN1908_c0_g4_i1.p1  ORF type:complete len:292 (-),score=59.63 TRINITY_DN1908_c0_g4_i1:137-1012(-)